MTREIKFRAWDKVNRIMVSLEGFYELPLKNPVLEYMQYTGLKDKNGKEIYEGDIVDIPNFKGNWKRGEPDGNWKRFKVKWNQHVYAFKNEWIYKPFSSYDTSDLMQYEIEIIGNIYENPNLLK